MKSFKSILCASLLTLAISSVALAGNISGKPDSIPSQDRTGNISGRNGNISGLTDEAYAALLGLLNAILP